MRWNKTGPDERPGEDVDPAGDRAVQRTLSTARASKRRPSTKKKRRPNADELDRQWRAAAEPGLHPLEWHAQRLHVAPAILIAKLTRLGDLDRRARVDGTTVARLLEHELTTLVIRFERQRAPKRSTALAAPAATPAGRKKERRGTSTTRIPKLSGPQNPA
jgi:hypothetical protein